MKVDINSGRDPSIAAVAPQLTDHLRHLDQDVFVCESQDFAGRDAVLPSLFNDSSWKGPPLHDVVSRGELAEWRVMRLGGWLR